MKFGTSAVEQSGPIPVDNAFRPGKGSRPRPISSIKTLHRNLERIFKWSRRQRSSKQ